MQGRHVRPRPNLWIRLKVAIARWLSGDWQGGRPLAYGFGITANPYPEDKTRTVKTLAELVAFAEHHMSVHVAKLLAD